ncbi:FHA domain-containing protein [Sandaracinus amylolyticus]|uniref:FHA domain-containing protein n=1 Tax=Sandaracinus amylolyticus TaxID=927083 RepID=UPI001F2A58B4|nr:FHA domain-containing protein [Sandaracinus amylolyticus]UJR80482.1 FHA domain-containing protein [Sandaracinus amylolyticus]
MQKLGSGIAFVDAIDLARKHDDTKLAELLGPAQLLGAPPTVEDDEDEWSFQTRAILRPELGARLGLELSRAYVFPVRKLRSTFADTILVGRASTSDVFVDDASISKLHARIRRQSDDAWTIADAGSTNGTAIGTRAINGEESSLPYGTRLRIGKWSFRFERLDGTLAILRNG